ncbi:MAG: hypothetical protein E7441_02145 [Ruminococcaceae bacterium]|nr:hypothetical protein [Oscillospiraceae bacterium]
MRKSILRKAMSAVLALTLAVGALGSTTLFASAAKAGDVINFGFSPTNYYIRYENPSMSGMSGKFLDNEGVIAAFSDYFESETYCRNWKFFSQYWPGSSNVEWGLTGSNGLYVLGGRHEGWFALKAKGFDAGKYNISVASVPQRGCVWELYVLDNSIYGDASQEVITDAIANYAETDGIQRVGEVDFYGKMSQGAVDVSDSTVSDVTHSGDWVLSDFGSADFTGGAEAEQILVFYEKEDGSIDEDEGDVQPGNRNSEYFLSLFGIKFTYQTELSAQNKETFGNTAAFFEKTEDNDCNVYLVSAIESLQYSKAGFKVAVGDEAAEEVDTDTVYEKLTVDETEYTASDFGLEKGFLYVVKKTLESFAGQTIDFKPFAVNSTGEIAGSTYRATVSVSGGNQ